MWHSGVGPWSILRSEGRLWIGYSSRVGIAGGKSSGEQVLCLGGSTTWVTVSFRGIGGGVGWEFAYSVVGVGGGQTKAEGGGGTWSWVGETCSGKVWLCISGG